MNTDKKIELFDQNTVIVIIIIILQVFILINQTRYYKNKLISMEKGWHERGNSFVVDYRRQLFKGLYDPRFYSLDNVLKFERIVTFIIQKNENVDDKEVTEFLESIDTTYVHAQRNSVYEDYLQLIIYEKELRDPKNLLALNKYYSKYFY